MSNPTQRLSNGTAAPAPSTGSGHGAAPAPAIVANTPPAPAITFAEAPASLNLRFDYRGATGLQLTLRDVNGSTLLDKLDAVLDRLERMGATFNAPAPARASQVAPAGTPMCPDGHGPMKESTKKAGTFFCPHVIAESAGKKIYCQQKA